MTKANLKRLEEGKLYYSISEVCAMTGLEQHVLRYWESEFPQLRPKKNRSGNRAYRSKEIKIIRYIKYLLYEEMYTIPGAKKKMADMNVADLEGQLSLLRVPASVPPSKEPPADLMSGKAEDGERGAAPAVQAPGEDVHPAPTEAGAEVAGVDSAARLREELKRVKRELQELLAALAAAGKGFP